MLPALLTRSLHTITLTKQFHITNEVFFYIFFCLGLAGTEKCLLVKLG